MSKQIYLGRVFKSGSSGPASRFATTVPFALKGSVAGFKGLRPPAAGPLSEIPESRWLVNGGWGLLAGNC